MKKKIIQNILDNNGKITITSISKDANIETIYTFKHETKIIIFINVAEDLILMRKRNLIIN